MRGSTTEPDTTQNRNESKRRAPDVGSKLLGNGKVWLCVTKDENGEGEGVVYSLLQSNLSMQSATKKRKVPCRLGCANCSEKGIDIDARHSLGRSAQFRHTKACRESEASRERSVELLAEEAEPKEKAAEKKRRRQQSEQANNAGLGAIFDLPS